MLFKTVTLPESVPLPLESVQTEAGRICLSGKKINNRTVRALLLKEKVSTPNAVSYWNNLFTNLIWKNIWSLPYKYYITNKIKEVSLKLIHRIYPSNLFMQRYKKDINERCSFCKQAPEDLQHLFWSCPHLQSFWKNVSTFIRLHVDKNFVLDYQNVLFGFFSVTASQLRQYFIINLLFLAKSHIHNHKFTNEKPCIHRFRNKIKQYINLISQSGNKKAIKTIEVFSLFPRIWIDPMFLQHEMYLLLLFLFFLVFSCLTWYLVNIVDLIPSLYVTPLLPQYIFFFFNSHWWPWQ